MGDRVSARFEKARVKHVATHRKSPLALALIYNGDFELWNTSSASLLKSGTVGEVPIRAGDFLEEKEWFVIGSDDGVVRIYSIDTFELKCKVQAHQDFIRKIVVHPSLPYIATCSDDTTVKLWDYSKDLSPVRTLEGHKHFVMSGSFSTKDNRALVTCSLDSTVRVWNIETGETGLVLSDSEAGQNAVAYIAEKYIVSGSDDGKISVWDSAGGGVVASIYAHTGPVTSVFPTSRGFVTAGEDGVVREWGKKRFRPESSVGVRLQRVWSVAQMYSGDILVGGDEGLCFVRKAAGEVLFSFKMAGGEARIILNEDTSLKQIKSTNLFASKVVATLDYVPDRIELSDTGRYLAVESGGTTHIYTLLGFLQQLSVPGSSVIWTGAEDFLLVYEGAIVRYADFEIEGKMKTEIEERIKSVQKVGEAHILAQTKEERSHLIDKKGKILLKTEKAVGAHLYKNTAVVVYEGRVEMRRLGEEESIECKIKVLSWCARDNAVFVHTGGKVVYFVVPENKVPERMVPVACCQIGAQAVLMEASESIWYVESGKVARCEVPWDLISVQSSIVSGVLPETVPESLEKECIHFLMEMEMFEEAYAITKDQDEKFELLLRLGRIGEAKGVADSEAKYAKLTSLFIGEGDVVSALECAKKSMAVENEALLASLCNDMKSMETAARKAYSQGKSLVAIAAAYRSGNIALCGKILENTPFEKLFKKTYGAEVGEAE